MSMLYVLTAVFQAIAAVTAIMVARRRTDYRPVALFMGAMVLANAIKTAIRLSVLVPARNAGAVPFTGWVLCAGVAESALFLSWSAGFVALAIAVFLGRRPWPALAAWGLAVVILAVGMPQIRGDALRRYYLACELAALAGSLGAVGGWLFSRREPPRLPHLVVAILLTVELAGLVVGPWPFGLFESWNLAQIAYCVLYATMIGIQGAVLWILLPHSQ